MRYALLILALLLTACQEGNCEDAPIVEIDAVSADGVNQSSLVCLWMSPTTDTESVWFEAVDGEVDASLLDEDGNTSCWRLSPFADAPGEHEVIIHAMDADGCRADLVTAVLSFS